MKVNELTRKLHDLELRNARLCQQIEQTDEVQLSQANKNEGSVLTSIIEDLEKKLIDTENQVMQSRDRENELSLQVS